MIDTLRRLDLAAPDLQVTTLDISTRVNDHVRRIRENAAAGRDYTIQVPRDNTRTWSAYAAAYWEHFGDQIGKSVAPITPPGQLSELKLRAIRLPPSVVRMVAPADLNIVTQTQEAEGTYDMLIGTNIFVYYGVFDQGLALANSAHMLRSGGLLLSNDALAGAPGIPLRHLSDTDVPYSDRASDGDRIVCYQRDAQTSGRNGVTKPKAH